MRVKNKNFPTLKEGDAVEIVAPGYGGDFKDAEKAAAFIESLGLKANLRPDIFGEDIFCSNTDEYRLNHLTETLFNSEAKALWCFKGGYGTTRIIPQLAKSFYKSAEPKLLIGFSDITALHLLFNQNFKWPSLHAPVLWQIVNDKISPDSLNKLKEIIFGRVEKITLSNLEPMNIAANRKITVESTLTGGNLALLQAMVGTPYGLNAKNKVVLIEEIDERAYRVDRMLTHLTQGKILDKATAIILGDFIEKETQDKINITLRRWAETMNVPVLLSKSVGHGMINDPIPFGTSAELDFDKEINLDIYCK